MGFKWNVAFAAMAVVGAGAAFIAGFGCLYAGEYGGAIIAAIVMCGCVFAAAGLIGGM